YGGSTSRLEASAGGGVPDRRYGEARRSCRVAAGGRLVRGARACGDRGRRWSAGDRAGGWGGIDPECVGEIRRARRAAVARCFPGRDRGGSESRDRGGLPLLRSVALGP